jgi:RIO kinase 1
MYHVEIVHADLSEYNILMYRGLPYIIDVGQAVVLEHPSAYDFLKRDIHNIVLFFRKYGIKADEKKIYEQLVGKGELP